MNHLNIIGRKVKYFAAVRTNSLYKLYDGEELIICGIDTKKKRLVLETPSGEIWKLYPNDVRYLNNQKVTIY